MPKLGLAIPASPSQRPVTSHAVPPIFEMPKQTPPKLSLATPMGSHGVPHEAKVEGRRKLPQLKIGIGNSSTRSGNEGSSDDSARSRSNSINANANSTSTTASSYSALNFAEMLRGGTGSEDPLSEYTSSSAGGSLSGGAGMERENSMQGANLLPDLEKMSLEKGRPLDVEDLDDSGWKAASKEQKIIELGSLGEGAGGAVTRCILKGGKTVFALKVGSTGTLRCQSVTDFGQDHYDRPEPRCQEADSARASVQ